MANNAFAVEGKIGFVFEAVLHNGLNWLNWLNWPVCSVRWAMDIKG